MSTEVGTEVGTELGIKVSSVMGPGVGTWVGIADAAPVTGWQVGFQDWVQQVSPKTGDTLAGCADPAGEEEPGSGEGSGQASPDCVCPGHLGL